MEMRCFCKLLGISYKDHITNEQVTNTIQQAIRPFENLFEIVKSSMAMFQDCMDQLKPYFKALPMEKEKGEDRRNGQEFCKITMGYRGQENMERAGWKVFCGV